jgi:hypothetical protein
MPARDLTSRPDIASRPDIYTASATSPRNRPEPVPPAPQNPAARARVAEEPAAYAPPAGPVPPVPQVQVPPGTPEPVAGADATQPPSGQLRRLPSARTTVSQGQHAAQSQPGLSQPGLSQPGLSQPGLSQPGQAQPGQGQHAAQSQPSQGQLGQGQLSQSQLGQGQLGQSQLGQSQSGQGSPRSAPYSGPQPVMNQAASAVYQAQNGAPGVSLSEAVQAAHEEGQEFGGSVARDAPALWLEAVLARKPRMPSDLEARLLQGSELPIDFLLHDEVRHALRRGFWDALERTRR